MIHTISDLKKSDNFFLLAGPCLIEGEDMALRIAERVVKKPISWVYLIYLRDRTVKLTAHAWIRLWESAMKRL